MRILRNRWYGIDATVERKVATEFNIIYNNELEKINVALNTKESKIIVIVMEDNNIECHLAEKFWNRLKAITTQDNGEIDKTITQRLENLGRVYNIQRNILLGRK